ncbi:tape measure protein [Bacteroides stercoris]|uniref:tape measure protein n=1 Tax=Bacteroides stercoris TaxID=46506 RepID=UPI00321B14DF
MAKLYFKVGSDWEEVVRLRNEIAKLKQELMSMDGTQSPAAFKALNAQLAASSQRLDELVTNAAKAGAEMETGFKRKIFDASQVVNGLSEKITFQRGTIQQLKNELAGLKDKYKEALKADGDVTGLGIKVKSVNARLSEQKSVLFDLTQQQAGARLNVKKLRDEYELYKENGEEVNETNESLAMSWGKVIGAIGGAAALKSFISEMVNVRGEFQQLEIAFGTMLKSKEKADKLMAELVDIAAKTPFDLQGVASSAKQMLAYGSSAESVGKELVMLGNVAAGVGAQLGDIAYLYGTLRTQGRAYAVDIRQFAGRGIPIYEELAKVMGVTKDEVSDLVSQGKVGFKEVEQAFQNMTKEGGMYFNLMQEQSKSLTGQISNLGDAWDSMLNEMGKKGEGVFYTAISAAKSLVENYEKVGMVIEGLIITYGAYKTALMANIALGKIQAANRLASIKGVTAMKMVTDLMTGSVAKLNKVLMLNPYALVGAAALASSIYMLKWADSQDKCTEATERFNKAEEASKQAREERNRNVNEYIKIASDEKRTTDERKIAIESLKDAYKNLLPQYDKESFLLKNIAEYKKKINEEELRNERIGTKTKLIMLDRDIAKYKNGLKEANRQGAGQATQAIMNTLNNLKKERELYDKKLQQLESESSTGTGKKEEKVKNKTYWEKQKKDAQAALDAIDSVKRKKMNTGDFKGIDSEDKNIFQESKKKIKEAEKHLKAYEKEEKIQKEAGKKLKQQEKISEQLLSLRRKNQQDEINLMADGTEKKLAQIDLDYQKELDAIKKQRKDWETAQGGKLTDKQEAKLGTWASNAAKKRESDIDSTSKAKLEADKKAWQEYFIEFGNYQEKRKNLIQKYDDEIAKLQSDSPEYAIKVAEKNQAVEQLDEQYGRTTRAMADLFEDASNKSVSAIQDIIDKYEALIEYMSGTDKDISIADLKGIGFTDKDIEKIEKGEISIKDVTDAIRGLKDELKGKSPWQTFVSDLEKGIEAIKKGGSDSKKVGQGITDIGNAVTSFAPALGEFGSNIANIFGVSDSAITGVTDALGGLGTTAAGVGQIMSGDIVGGAMSAVSGISSVVSAFEGLFGADYSDYENMKAQYGTLIAIWDELITKKMDYIDIDYGTEAIKAAEEAEQLVNIQISRQRQLIKQLASSGASAGSHSLGYRINDRLSKEDYQRISGLVGQKITAEYQLWDLSSEQIEKILSDEKLVSVLDTVNKDFVTYLQNIVDYGEQLTEIAQKEKEAITGIGFDEFKNGYADLLSDLDSTNEDFANNFEKDLRKAIFQSLIANKYKDKIKELYDAWANYGKDGLSSDEAREIRDMQAQLTDSLLAEREQLMKDFGWSLSTEQQSASSKGFQTMSQDTGEELNGRFTALQIAGEEIKNQNIIQSQSLNLLTVKADAILSMNTETRNIADDTRDLIAQSYLELVQISENTGAIVKPIIQIQKDMAEVKNNTSKL